MSIRNLRIRPGRQEDYRAFVELFSELGTNDPVLDEARFAKDIAPTGLFAEDPSGNIVGYAFYQIFAGTIYVRNLVTARQARRRGVGSTLMEAIAGFGCSSGCASWRLNVRPENVAAVALYEKLGFRIQYESYALRLAWALTENCQLVEGIFARRIDPSDDAALERSMGFLSGQLAATRLNADRVLLLIETPPIGIVGAAIFNPLFPGAYPFHVSRPELAFSLLRALRPYAKVTDTFVHVVIEDQLEVANFLMSEGATLNMRTVHMLGSL